MKFHLLGLKCKQELYPVLTFINPLRLAAA
jgi:hypothetical protein